MSRDLTKPQFLSALKRRGMCANSKWGDVNEDHLAGIAADQADFMLAERRKRESGS